MPEACDEETLEANEVEAAGDDLPRGQRQVGRDFDETSRELWKNSSCVRQVPAHSTLAFQVDRAQRHRWRLADADRCCDRTGNIGSGLVCAFRTLRALPHRPIGPLRAPSSCVQPSSRSLKMTSFPGSTPHALVALAFSVVSTIASAQVVEYELVLTSLNFGGVGASQGTGNFTVDGPIPTTGASSFATGSFMASLGSYSFDNQTLNVVCPGTPGPNPQGGPATVSFMNGLPTGISYYRQTSDCAPHNNRFLTVSFVGNYFQILSRDGGAEGLISFVGPVPEPGTYVLLSAGLAVLTLSATRRRQKLNRAKV